MSELKLREIILNTRKPLVLRSYQCNWKCFEGTLDTWCARYDESASELCSFERMSKKHWNEPQWERNRTKVQMSFVDFLQHFSNVDSDWFGFNYVTADKIPAGCKDGVNFEHLGFPHLAEETNFWLSSNGANTPCHYDTYGCNVVKQIYGRKSWILFPPSTQLTKTRIPYEETSVYCMENFYSPNLLEIQDLMRLKENVYRCVLEPGDVLIVPRQWWHYVESIETSLSVNAWIPLKCDLEARIEECIVNFLMHRLVANDTDAVKRYMLNPNELEQIISETDLFAILKYLLKAREQQSPAKLCEQKYPYQYLDEEIVDEMLKEFPTLVAVERLKSEEFKNLLIDNSKRYERSLPDCDNTTTNFLKERLVNAICSPDVIQLIKKKFDQTMYKEKNKSKLIM